MLVNILWAVAIVAVLGGVVKVLFFPKKIATGTGNVGGSGGSGTSDSGTNTQAES